MLFPVLNNFRIDFFNCDENYGGFFDPEMTQKYDKYFYRLNTPLKKFRDYFLNQIQNVSVPGIATQGISINSLPNLGANFLKGNPTSINREIVGTANENDVKSGKTFGLTSKNTLINWLYAYEYSYKHRDRSRKTGEFGVVITIKNEAFVDVLRFTFRNCYISAIPGLTFAFNENFATFKDFELEITYNNMDVDFIIPDFNVSELATLKF